MHCNFFINVKKSYAVEMKKFSLCWELLKLKHQFDTDVNFPGYPVMIDIFDYEENTGWFIIEGKRKIPPTIRFIIQKVYLTNKNNFSLAISRRRIAKNTFKRRTNAPSGRV